MKNHESTHQGSGSPTLIHLKNLKNAQTTIQQTTKKTSEKFEKIVDLLLLLLHICKFKALRKWFDLIAYQNNKKKKLNEK